MRRLHTGDDSGAPALEYVILIFAVSLTAIFGIMMFGDKLKGIISDQESMLAGGIGEDAYQGSYSFETLPVPSDIRSARFDDPTLGARAPQTDEEAKSVSGQFVILSSKSAYDPSDPQAWNTSEQFIDIANDDESGAQQFLVTGVGVFTTTDPPVKRQIYDIRNLVFGSRPYVYDIEDDVRGIIKDAPEGGVLDSHTEYDLTLYAMRDDEIWFYDYDDMRYKVYRYDRSLGDASGDPIQVKQLEGYLEDKVLIDAASDGSYKMFFDYDSVSRDSFVEIDRGAGGIERGSLKTFLNAYGGLGLGPSDRVDICGSPSSPDRLVVYSYNMATFTTRVFLLEGVESYLSGGSQCSVHELTGLFDGWNFYNSLNRDYPIRFSGDVAVWIEFYENGTSASYRLCAMDASKKPLTKHVIKSWDVDQVLSSAERFFNVPLIDGSVVMYSRIDVPTASFRIDVIDLKSGASSSFKVPLETALEDPLYIAPVDEDDLSLKDESTYLGGGIYALIADLNAKPWKYMIAFKWSPR